ncbi:MAG: hypothetical protein RL095_100 [Verrucomicrobiota bacterium]
MELQEKRKAVFIRALIVSIFVVAIVAAALVSWILMRHSKSLDEKFVARQGPSSDLKADLAAMWKLAPNPSVLEKTQVSPASAANAAGRVMKSLESELLGKTLDEVKERLGFPEGWSTATCPRPFHNGMLTFDNGRYGLTFVFVLGAERRVTKIIPSVQN